MSHPWEVTVYLVETPDDARGPLTRAHAVLAAADGTTVDGYGRSRAPETDDDPTSTRHALAVAGALRDLARRLVLEAGEVSGLERDELLTAC
ncbi:dsRBD fold-containing protein [Cellulomonas fimi]|uniref:dsRBD fold-containing protein n=1 Tax=Cellulomonas fimi TaxID=1708 RepID=UPI002358EAA3|nr:dsRBD fold-containing protein [Cellulomonas fimi]